jgi:hypothetical protein
MKMTRLDQHLRNKLNSTSSILKLKQAASTCALALAALLLVNCGSTTSSTNGGGGNGGGGNGGGNNNTIPVGIYSGAGSLNVSGTVTQPQMVAMVTSSGTYTLLSYEAGIPNYVYQIDTGTGSVSNGSFTSSNDQDLFAYQNYEGYDNFGSSVLAPYQGAALSATYVANTSINGQVTYPGQGATLAFPLEFVSGSTVAPSSLAAIAGTHTGTFYSYLVTDPGEFSLTAGSSFTISDTGVLTGTVTAAYGGTLGPCTVSGTVTPRTDLNAYNFSFSFANGTGSSQAGDCSFAIPPGSYGWTGGTATGLGYYNSSTGKLIIGAANGTTPFTFSN